MSAAHAVLVGFLVLGLFWFLTGLSTGWNPWKLIVGEDGIASTSKFQFFCWTAVALFAYAVIFCFKARAANWAPLSVVPVNLLLAMGISSASAVAAKAIAVSSAPPTATVVAVTPAPPAPDGTPVDQVTVATIVKPKLGGILQDDNGAPDLTKIQMIMWTVIAIGMFLTRVANVLATDVRQIPDIDRTLMLLMGLGHTAYLGKKIAVAQSSSS